MTIEACAIECATIWSGYYEAALGCESRCCERTYTGGAARQKQHQLHHQDGRASQPDSGDVEKIQTGGNMNSMRGFTVRELLNRRHVSMNSLHPLFRKAGQTQKRGTGNKKKESKVSPHTCEKGMLRCSVGICHMFVL